MNPVENVWQYLRSNFLSNRVVATLSRPPAMPWRRLNDHPEVIPPSECANGRTSVKNEAVGVRARYCCGPATRRLRS
ncbi:hypothetical protein [Xanthobacter sediminis]